MSSIRLKQKQKRILRNNKLSDKQSAFSFALYVTSNKVHKLSRKVNLHLSFAAISPKFYSIYTPYKC